MEDDPAKRSPEADRDVTPSILYFDVYDNSLVRATYSGGQVALVRDDGTPMWNDGTNTIEHDRWESLLQGGFFVPIDPQASPEVAARKLSDRLEE